MKVLLLNLPNAVRIQRRYMCSYHAESMLLPPQELVALGGILKAMGQRDYQLIDCMAENLTTAQLSDTISGYQPGLIVTIQGFECFEEDMAEIEHIKTLFPKIRLVLFGHYATVFYREILEKTKVDLVILGEPDLIFRDLMDALSGGQDLSFVPGIAYRSGDGITANPGESRIRNPQDLPMPAYELLQADKYYEPFMPRPLGLIQSARGCPYGCNYCVRSFGKKLTYRTPDQIVEEIIYLQQTLGIKSLRFIDDTFTAHPKRVVEICEKMMEKGIRLPWTCLSRLDTLKPDVIPLMKAAGCKRIYFGVESGSPKVLAFLNKPLDLTDGVRIVQACRQHGIETLGWFIVGAPPEDDAAFEESVQFALAANFDYISVSELTIYPGTELYEKMQLEIDFSLLPYRNRWKDQDRIARNKARERIFYRRFYFRMGYVWQTIQRILRHPGEYMRNGLKLAYFLIRPPKDQRADYF